jgi:thiamine kinase-like enzyme
VKRGAVEAAIRAALARALPEAAAGALTYRPLAGGLNTRSFHVTAGGCDVVVRLPLGGAPPLLDLATEAAVMRAAAAAGAAPRVVDADPASGVLVTEFLAGAAAWTAVAAREPRNVARLAELLRRLHATPAAAPRFAAGAIAARYVAAAAAATAEDPRWGAELVRRARDFDARHTGDALCHNDLFAANVLDDGGLVLVDFEYAVRAAPLLDLASFAAMNDTSAELRRTLLTQYYRGAVPPGAEAELDGAVRMVRLMGYFWSLLGLAGAVDTQPYAELAASLAQMLHRDRV